MSYVKTPPGKGYGFVLYIQRSFAKQAIEKMNRYTIGTSRIRLYWGISQKDRLPTAPVWFLFNSHYIMSPQASTSTSTSLQYIMATAIIY